MGDQDQVALPCSPAVVLQRCSGDSAGAAGVVVACLEGHQDLAGRQGSRGMPREEARSAGNHLGQEGTIRQEGIPCRSHRVQEEEDRLDPIPAAGLVGGKVGTCWGFESQERLEDLVGWGRRERDQGGIVPV